MDYVGTELGYQVFRNSDGFLEGYKKTIGRNIGLDANNNPIPSDCKRVVTNQTTMKGFVDYVNGLKKKKSSIKPETPPSLFNDEI